MEIEERRDAMKRMIGIISFIVIVLGLAALAANESAYIAAMGLLVVSLSPAS
jgi:hypothetical protein